MIRFSRQYDPAHRRWRQRRVEIFRLGFKTVQRVPHCKIDVAVQDGNQLAPANFPECGIKDGIRTLSIHVRCAQTPGDDYVHSSTSLGGRWRHRLRMKLTQDDMSENSDFLRWHFEVGHFCKS